jgi:hypothetical protein
MFLLTNRHGEVHQYDCESRWVLPVCLQSVEAIFRLLIRVLAFSEEGSQKLCYVSNISIDWKGPMYTSVDRVIIYNHDLRFFPCSRRPHGETD